MTAREIVRRRLRHEGTDVTPYGFSVEPGLKARLDEHYGDPDWQAKRLRRFTTGGVGVSTSLQRKIDDVYSEDAYGTLWRMDKKPWHIERPGIPSPSFEGYGFPPASLFVEAAERSKAHGTKFYEADDEHFRIIHMGGGIFEMAWMVRGFENSLMDSAIDADFYSELTSRLTRNFLAMLKVCADIPADGYWFGDDWGDQRGVIIGADRWRRFLKPCWERIYGEVHAQGKLVIQHACGSISDIYDDLAEIGMDCHESVQPEARNMSPDYIKARWGAKISFWGCLGSQGTLHSGSPKEIKDEIFRLRDLFKDDGGFVLAPAKPLPDEMPLDKALAVIDALSELNG